MYDVIVIGAGPSGLAVAQGCARFGQRVLVIDREATIGGCHRVRRVDGGLFTEHGPRIYNTNYRTFGRFLNEMGEGLHSLFVRADVALPLGIHRIRWRDRMAIFGTILRTTFQPGYGKDVSMAAYMDAHRFSAASRDAIDRACLATDGAAADRYTVFEFFNIIHQHAFSHVLEPRQPTDTGLFALWQGFLEARGVRFVLGADVRGIRPVAGGGIVEWGAGQTAQAARIVLAVPPEAAARILRATPVKDAFGPIDDFHRWAHATSYQDYVSFTMHFHPGAVAADVPADTRPTPWGVIAVPLSRYMRFVDLSNTGETVYSCIITRLDAVSPATGRSPNQSTMDELLAEAVRQAREAIPGLPEPDRTVVSPGAYWNPRGHWDDVDTAFVRIPGVRFIEQGSSTVPWLWNVGCHNGFQRYQFTSLEAAVSNSAALLHTWFGDQARAAYPILGPFELRQAIWILLGALALAAAAGAVLRSPRAMARAKPKAKAKKA